MHYLKDNFKPPPFSTITHQNLQVKKKKNHDHHQPHTIINNLYTQQVASTHFQITQDISILHKKHDITNIFQIQRPNN